MTSQMTPATTVVIAALNNRRGLAGAPAAWPGSSFAAGFTPQGSTAKIVIHQITTYMPMPTNQLIGRSRLLELDQGAVEILRMEKEHRLAMRADAGLAIAQDSRSRRFEAIAGRM